MRRRLATNTLKGNSTNSTAQPMDDDEDEIGEIIICVGPPLCLLQGDEAVQNQIDGCPKCRRVTVAPDGRETEYFKRAN